MPSVSTDPNLFLMRCGCLGSHSLTDREQRGHLAPWWIPGRCPAKTILPRFWGCPEWKHQGSAPATRDAARTGVLHKERRCCSVPRCLGELGQEPGPGAGWNQTQPESKLSFPTFDTSHLHKKISIMHFIIVVKHTREGFYAGLIMAHCNATLALLSHPLIHYIHNQGLCKKKRILMTFSRLLINKMVVLCIMIEKMFILRSHYPVLAEL